MWNLPGPGIKPLFPALAGGFPTTGPPGKSVHVSLKCVVTEKNPSVSGPAVQTHVVQGSTGYRYLIYVYVCVCI